MNKTISTIHMLILDPSSNEAEQTINILRNNGHAVRATQITKEDELETALEQQRWDLFIVRDNLENPSAEDCLRIVQHYGRDIPFIMTTDNYCVERALEILRLGMQDIVPADNEEFFRLVVERELGAIMDRKLRSQASTTLKEIEKRNELLLDSSRDAIAYITDGMHIYANNAYMELFSYEDPDDLACIPIMDLVHSEQQEEFKNYLKSHIKGEAVGELKFKGVKENQEQFDAIMTLTASQYDGEDCTQVYINTASSDDGELAEKLKELSVKDRLTGLYNQEYLLEALAESVSGATNSHQLWSLLYIELDHFDNFVDEYGISEMDAYIKQVANWLVDFSDATDSIARVADSTFAILTMVTKPEEGTQRAANLCKAFDEQMFEVAQKTHMDTVSVGVCAVSENSPQPQKILSNAHFACSRAQAKGGNQFKLHDSSLDALENRDDAQTAVEIQEAIEQETLKLSFEAIVKLKGSINEIYHSRLVLESEPGNLVPITEAFNIGLRTATAAKLDLWMVEQAAMHMKGYIQSYPEALLKLNLSPASLLEEDLVSKLQQRLEQAGLDNSHLIIEFNEEHVVAHLKQAIDVFKKLDQAGYTIGLADFGSSLNSTELLESVNVSGLRWLSIDHTLMAGFVSNTKAQERVGELCQFAHEHDYLTIIPSLEDAGSLALIWPLPADHIHGSYITHPSTDMDFNFEDNIFF